MLSLTMDGQMQQKLNRVASSAGSAPLAVSVAAILEVIAEVQEKRAKRKKEPEQVRKIRQTNAWRSQKPCRRLSYDPFDRWDVSDRLIAKNLWRPSS